MEKRICEMSDEEVIQLLDQADGSVGETFCTLVQLLGSKGSAAKAFKQESEFVFNNAVRTGKEEATRVRSYLIARNLEWSQKNLALAVAATQFD